MHCSMLVRKCGILLVVLMVLAPPLTASAADAGEVRAFADILGDFAQGNSGVGVIYAHVIGFAELYPTEFYNRVQSAEDGWIVTFADGSTMKVTNAEIQLSIDNGYSIGDPANYINIYSIAISKSGDGFNEKTGELDYGASDTGKLTGTGNWRLTGVTQGMKRLKDYTNPDGTLRIASTIGCCPLPDDYIARFGEMGKTFKDIYGRDLQVTSYDIENDVLVVRSMLYPNEPLQVPGDFLRKLPIGMDFMEGQVARTALAKAVSGKKLTVASHARQTLKQRTPAVFGFSKGMAWVKHLLAHKKTAARHAVRLAEAKQSTLHKKAGSTKQLLTERPRKAI